jgi:iron complex outermembrane receptor protein
MKNPADRTALINLRFIVLAAAATYAAGASSADPARDAQGGLSGGELETIVVTATRRNEKLENVPQSIRVLNEEFLDSIGSDSLESFAAYVPGLEMQTFSPGRSRITIRGISPDEQTGVTTISYYLDEIPLTTGDQRGLPTVRLYDIDRVEVLRGPQGTLYGEGAMGGTIRIINSKPDASGFSASAKFDGNVVDQGETGYVLDGMINVPLIDNRLAARIVAEDRRDPGWIDQDMLVIPDPEVGPPERYVVDHEEEDVNHSTATSVRAALRFTPTETFAADLTYIYDDVDVHSANIATVDAFHNSDLGLRPSTSNSDLWNLTVSYDFGNFVLTSATSQTSRDTWRFDPYEPIVFGTTAATTLSFTQFFDIEGFTEEVRAVSSSDQRLRWTIGAYYGDRTTRSGGSYDAFLPSVGSMVNFFSYTDRTDVISRAIFGEAEFDITDALTILAGARWFEEEQDSGPLHREADGTTPKLTLRYRFSDAFMAYASYAEGYRSGGFNPNAGPPEYEPDTTKNYEIGGKFSTADGRMTVSGAVYYISWNDMQFIQLDSGGFFTYIGNANKASSRGAEIEFSYRSDSGWWTQIGGNVTDAHLDSDVFGNFTGVIPSGRELPSVPPYKFSAVVGYDTTLFTDFTLGLTAGVSFVGEQDSKLEENGTYTDFLFGGTYVIGSTIPSYSSGNVRAEISRNAWSAAIYMNNVWNEETPLGNDNFLPTFGQPLYYMQPRTLGIEFGYRL